MEEKVAISDQSHLIAVRFWPGFSEKFPFHEVEDLPFLGRDDEKTLLAIQQAVANTHWASRNTIRESQLERASRWVEAVKDREQSSRRLGDDFSSRHAASVSFREPQLPEKDVQLNHTFGAMAELGWSRHSGLRGGGLPIVSARLQIIAIDNADLAQCIVDFLCTLEDEYLCKHFPIGVESVLKAKGLTAGEFFCPRISVISITEMSPAERAVAFCSFERLKTATEVTFYSRIARAYQVEAERLATAWARRDGSCREPAVVAAGEVPPVDSERSKEDGADESLHRCDDVRVPEWNQINGKLTYGNKVIRTYVRKAFNCFRILDAFQSSGWPELIPWPNVNDRDDSVRLGETVRTLNKEISEIRFRSGGDGKSVRWERQDVAHSEEQNPPITHGKPMEHT